MGLGWLLLWLSVWIYVKIEARGDEEESGGAIAVNGGIVKKSQLFYLGDVLDSEEWVKRVIRARVAQYGKSGGKLQDCWLRGVLFVANIRFVMLNGSETWTLTINGELLQEMDYFIIIIIIIIRKGW